MATYITLANGEVIDLETGIAKKSDLKPLQDAAATANASILASDKAHADLAAAAATAKADADAAAGVANIASTKAAAGISRSDMANSNLPSQPRVRVEKNTNLTLSTTWQRVGFTDTNALNINTFPMMTDNTTQTVRYDATNKLFKFGATEDRNHTLDLYMTVVNTNVLNVLTGNTMIKVQYRLVVPNGRGPGLDFYFPFPGTDGSDGYGEVGMTTSLVASQRLKISENIYVSQVIRTGGLGVDLKISGTPPLGSISCSTAIALLYGR